jgi:hypothetical protein
MATQMMNALRSFFDEDDWGYVQLEDRAILKLGFTGENGNWSCYAQCREADEQVVFYSICPITVPEKKRILVAELLTRANYGLVLGNFELDFDDGEIRYKTTADVQDGTLSQMMIKNAAYCNVLMMDKYLPGILAVIGGAQAPKDAIDEIESEDRQDMSKS